ncbi:MAG: hypothetical protein ACYDC8_10920 [Gammaproteobacteria bacterium]
MTTILNVKSRRGFIKPRIQFLSGLMIIGATLLACVGSAQAGTITGNIDTSSQFSPTNTSTDGLTYAGAPSASHASFPLPAVTIGEFDFSSMIAGGESIVGATVSGNFGSDTLGSGSSSVNLFLNGVAVASCDANCSFNTGSADVPWTFTFTSADLANLSSGKATLTGVQESPSQIVLDPIGIAIQTALVPIPGAAVLLSSALVPLLGFGRRKSSAALA